ncbi:MAG: translation initiation factor IF-3 [Deltaproteobacteria bacterium]|nr:translation initiation factor IF-3 [Deltaproteobacteria bacterium]MBW2306213.1 translation initiation factor IF-3 [Deltaproteobacteria bacterium]
MKGIVKRVNANTRIKAKIIRVIDPDGKQLGIMPLNEALEAARGFDLDLVEVAPNSNPPVCRIMDYGKFLYQESKKGQEARKKQTSISVKEVKIRPSTDEHDIQFKLRHIQRFLQAKNKVKVTVLFRGREITHPELGRGLIERIRKELEGLGTPEQEPRIEGRSMTMILVPRGEKSVTLESKRES